MEEAMIGRPFLSLAVSLLVVFVLKKMNEFAFIV
jgi:hypothetical protein